MKTEQRYPGIGRWISGQSRHTSAVIFWLLSLLFFRETLARLARLSFHDELASHILLIPLISAFLIYLERKQIFSSPRYCPFAGVPLLLATAVVWARLASINQVNRLSVAAALIVLTWIAVFIFFYGMAAAKAAAFPLLFLFLMSPLPGDVSAYAISILQKGSAATCYLLFRVVGVPVVRHGFQFSLPGVEIEVAEQCSGIHAGLALFIAGLLAQYFLLRDTWWKKACFILCIVPIAIFKNAVRIVTIAWLGIHVDRGFFQGALHHRGGLPFSLVAMAMMAALIWLLRLRVTSTSLRTQGFAEKPV